MSDPIVAHCTITKNLKTGETIGERIEPLPQQDPRLFVTDYAVIIAAELQKCPRFYEFCAERRLA